MERNVPFEIFSHRSPTFPTQSNIVTWGRGREGFPVLYDNDVLNDAAWTWLNGVHCAPFHRPFLSSRFMFYDERTPHGLMFMGKQPSGRCQRLTLSDHFFSSPFFLSFFFYFFIIELSKRLSLDTYFTPSYFSLVFPPFFFFFFFYRFFITPTRNSAKGIIVNEGGG